MTTPLPLESLIGLRSTSQGSPGETAPMAEAGWIDALRREALACFQEQGIPTRRVEAWKGTSFAPLSKMNFARVGRSANASLPAEEGASDAPTLVFIDGEFDPAASDLAKLPAGVRASSLAEVLAQEPTLVEGRLGALIDLKTQPIAALQTAFLNDGAVLVIDPDVRSAQPIRLRFISTRVENAPPEEHSAAFPRLLVIAGARSEASILQEHVCADGASGLTAYVAEFHLGEGARIETLELQAEGPSRIHFTAASAHLEQEARFDSHVISTGTGLLRSELLITLAGRQAETRLCGLFVGKDAAHQDHFTTVDHAVERCNSDEEYRGVLADESKAVFRGRVLVRPDAQSTDAKQSNANLILSDRATIDTKPQLEIYADDIRASHGSTIGQLDANALFFLRARGIELADAKRLLTGAFARGVVARIDHEMLRDVATEVVDAALDRLAIREPDPLPAPEKAARR